MFGRVGNRSGKMKVALQCIWEAKPYSSVLELGTAAFAIVLSGTRIADTFSESD